MTRIKAEADAHDRVDLGLSFGMCLTYITCEHAGACRDSRPSEDLQHSIRYRTGEQTRF